MSEKDRGEKRRARVARTMRSHLAEMIRIDLKDPRLDAVPLVSVNLVELNRDMSVARVFVGFPGADRGPAEAAVAALAAGAGRLRGPLARRMNLARAPELRFSLDTSQEFGQRLTEIVREDARRAGEPETEGEASRAGPGSGAASDSSGQDPEREDGGSEEDELGDRSGGGA